MSNEDQKPAGEVRPREQSLLREYAAGRLDHKSLVDRTTLPSSDAAAEIGELSQRVDELVDELREKHG